MNAVALAQGWTVGGPEGARESLSAFWEAVADSTPFELDLLQSLYPNGDGALPGPVSMMLGLTKLFSPDQLNPFKLNPLGDWTKDDLEAYFAEHYTIGREPSPAPDLMIAAAAQRTRQIKLGAAAHLVPYHNPISLAHRLTRRLSQAPAWPRLSASAPARTRHR